MLTARKLLLFIVKVCECSENIILKGMEENFLQTKKREDEIPAPWSGMTLRKTDLNWSSLVLEPQEKLRHRRSRMDPVAGGPDVDDGIRKLEDQLL